MAGVQAQIDTLTASANVAIASADWGTAETDLMQAKTLMVSHPQEWAHGQISTKREIASIDSLITDVRRRRAASRGIQRSNITYVRPTS